MQTESIDEAEINSNRDMYIYEYTEEWRIASAMGGGIKYTYVYDICGKLKSKSACGRMLISYEYDLNGNKGSVTDATGKTTYYEYDPDERYGRIKVTICESILLDIHYKYDNKGNFIRKVNFTYGVNAVTDYKYDGGGRLTGVKEPDLNERYSYGRAGNRITYANDKGISESYNYNETNELLSI